jgi:hypothetical protein
MRYGKLASEASSYEASIDQHHSSSTSSLLHGNRSGLLAPQDQPRGQIALELPHNNETSRHPTNAWQKPSKTRAKTTMATN